VSGFEEVRRRAPRKKGRVGRIGIVVKDAFRDKTSHPDKIDGTREIKIAVSTSFA
jgi:hypothetical protein